MHSVVDGKQTRRAIETLSKLRLNNHRTSDFFRAHQDQSIHLCALDIESCTLAAGTNSVNPEKCGCGAPNVYVVTDNNGDVSFC